METSIMIENGSSLPPVTFKQVSPEKGIVDVNSDSLWTQGSHIIIGVPGAFTPVCTESHLPSFIKIYSQIIAKGIDKIFCISVNDPFVMSAWAHHLGSDSKVTYLADWKASFTKAIGMDFDGSALGLGIRSKRYSLFIENGIIKSLEVEATPGVCEITQGENFMKSIGV